MYLKGTLLQSAKILSRVFRWSVMAAACILGQSLGSLLEAGLECHEPCLRNACEKTGRKVRASDQSTLESQSLGVRQTFFQQAEQMSQLRTMHSCSKVRE